MQKLKLRALGKQSKLMEIGHARHHQFKMFLLGRSLKSDYEYFWVGNVADEGADAYYMEEIRNLWESEGTCRVLEAYELTNYKRFRDPFPRYGKLDSNKVAKEKKAQSEPLYKNRDSLTSSLPIDPYYLPKNMFVQIGHEALSSHIYHFEKVEEFFGYPVKKYAIISYPENLTEHALWEYAKNGIMIKVMGHQD